MEGVEFDLKELLETVARHKLPNERQKNTAANTKLSLTKYRFPLASNSYLDT